MYTSIDNRFVLVEGKENANFTKLISELHENNMTFYVVEPERKFSKEPLTEIVSPRVVLDCDDDYLMFDEYEEILKKYKRTVRFYAKTLMRTKYLIVFSCAENAHYSDKDIIGEYASLGEASLAFDKLEANYSGTRDIKLLEEIYLINDDDNDIMTFAGCGIIDEITRGYKETYSITSADYYNSYSQISGNDYGVICALNKKMLDYVDPEKAQKIFDVIKSAFEDVFEEENFLSVFKEEATMQLIEDGMLVSVQETLNLLESIYKNSGLTIVLVKETYKKAAIGEKPELKKRQIIDCIAGDARI